MRTKLITALRIAANKLESGEFAYDWGKPQACNCGVVACAILGKSRRTLHNEYIDSIWFNINNDRLATWKDVVGHYCPVTGLPTHQIFKELFDAGMTAKDIVQLEVLSNPEVCAKTQLKPIKVKNSLWKWLFKGEPKFVQQQQKINYRNKYHAVLYFRAWAKLIEEQERDDSPNRVGRLVMDTNNKVLTVASPV